MLFFLKFLSIEYPTFWISGYKIIDNKTLYNTSINTIFVKYKYSASNPKKNEFKSYVPSSNITVAPATINIIVNLFSFEKFLSKYAAK